MKDRAKTFMFVAIGLLAISLAVQNFTLEATAQTDQAVAIVRYNETLEYLVLFQSGDIYAGPDQGGWSYFGNPHGGVATQGKSVSDIKSKW